MSKVGKNPVKAYSCPQGGCLACYTELIVLKGHMAVAHRLWLECTEEVWEEGKRGKPLKVTEATMDQAQWGYCKVKKIPREDFIKAYKDHRVDEWGRSTGSGMEGRNSLIGLSGGLVSFPSPYVPRPIPSSKGKGKENVPYFPSKINVKVGTGRSLEVVKSLGTTCIPSEKDLIECRRLEEIQLFEEFKLQRKQLEEDKQKSDCPRENLTNFPPSVDPSHYPPTNVTTLDRLVVENMASAGPDMLTTEQLFVEILEEGSNAERKRRRENEEAVYSIMPSSAKAARVETVTGPTDLDCTLYEQQLLVENLQFGLNKDLDLMGTGVSGSLSLDSDVGESASRAANPVFKVPAPVFSPFTSEDINKIMALLSDGKAVGLPLKIGSIFQLLANHFPHHDPQVLIVIMKTIVGTFRLTVDRSDMQMLDEEEKFSLDNSKPVGPTRKFSSSVRHNILRRQIGHVDLLLGSRAPFITMAMLSNGLVEEGMRPVSASAAVSVRSDTPSASVGIPR